MEPPELVGSLSKIAVKDEVVYATTHEGYVVTWNQKRMTVSSQKVNQRGLASLTLHGGTLYAGGMYLDGRIFSVPLDTRSELTVLRGHDGTVLDMVVANDLLYSGGSDDFLLVWDLGNSGCLQRKRTDHVLVNAVAADSESVYTGGIDRCIRVHGREDLSPTALLRGTDASIMTLAVDEHIVFSGSGEIWWGGPGSPRPSEFESSIRVWDKSDWSCIATLRIHKDNVNRILLGRGYLYTASDDGTVSICQRSDFSTVIRMRIGAKAIRDLAADSRYLYALHDDSSIRVIDRRDLDTA